ncbi:triacylglycerol lipase [Arthrobacter sp. GMC3]|uniref:esterase/lipase family protein n=1 Tax=Arthrobacter sp. GMC3 TaxID=2058894 RepID=UPI000CE543CD|nr:alpha/beta hydrolase [Arthrobacter sp. GMC3]
MKRLLRPWWWLLDYLYAGWRQLLSVFRRRCPAAYAVGDPEKPAVVLLPGVYETWLFLEPAAQRLNALGYRVFAVPQLGINRRSVPVSADLVGQALADLRSVHGVDQVVLLAHSKGGLIGKHVMLDADASSVEIRGLVAVATPFSGSLYARYLLSRTMRDFSPNDTVLMALQAETDINAQVVSIYPEFDPHIPGGSALQGAVNVEVPVSGHFRTLGDETVLTAVEQAVVGLSVKDSPTTS